MTENQASKSKPAEMVVILEERLAERTAELKATKEALEKEIQEYTKLQQTLADSERKYRIPRHKQTDEALRQSEERYRTLVEQARDGIVLVQGGKIRFANSYAAGLLGYAVEELLGSPFEIYLSADKVQEVADRYRKRMGGEAAPSVYEATLQHRDGSLVDVEVNIGLTTYEGKPAELVFVRDIRERVKARQELEESQRLLSLVIDHVPALVSYVDRRQRYRFVNRRYEQARGIPRAQFAGKHVQEILGPEGYAAAEGEIAAALAGETVSYEEAFDFPDSGRRWMSIEYVPDRDPAGDVQGFVGVIRDITERKKTEQALLESEEKLRAIYQAIPAATYTWQRKGDDFTLIDFNHMADRVTEGKVAELIGVRASDLYRDQPEIPQTIARCFAERVVIEQEVDYVYTTTGRRRRLHVKYGFAPPDLVVIHTEDITERVQAEQARAKSEAHLQRAQEVAHAGSWELDLVGGELFWSDEVYRIFGLPRENLMDYETFLNCVMPEDRDYVNEEWQAALAGAPYDIEHRIRVGDGVRWVREKAEVEFDQAGQAIRGIGIVIDITERKLVEQQILEYQRRLQALASQLTLVEERERRRIARELHDEVGQRLTFARMALASARETASEVQREILLDDVSQSVRQAIGDIRDLIFDLSSPLMNEVGLAAALEEWLENQVGKKHGLQAKLVNDGRRLPLDDDVRAMLFRSTRELLTNVVKHAHAESVIVRLEGEGTMVRITVEDDGIGFDLDALPKATERGGGFGLFSIQERMAALGGSLELISGPGQGCKAILIAPVTLQSGANKWLEG